MARRGQRTSAVYSQGKDAKGLISFYALISEVPREVLLIAPEWNPIAGYEPRKKPINRG